jgi:2-polyprenyl-3-methyl-5-hydroxy-6-metoxy-1,4-benzoquinol methylase
MAVNPVRLDRDRERAELRAYLGDDYDERRLQQYDRVLEEEFAEVGDEDAFYRESRSYLYNLTAFAMTGTKLPYLRELTRRVPPGARVLDYGCGIGSDGLMLLDAGYRVEFADFDNPSVEYLRWRLARRGVDAPVHDLDDGVPGGFDAAYSFDVIEHVPDPFRFLAELESRGRLVMVNLLEPEADDIALHHELPVDELLARCARGRIAYYGIHHGRSHLVAYSAVPAGPVRRALNRLRLAAGRLGRESSRASRRIRTLRRHG